MLAAQLDPKTGDLRIEGVSIIIGRGLTEATFKEFSAEVFTSVQGVTPPTSIYGSVPITLANRPLQVSVRFESGVLDSVAFSLLGLEWWTRE